MDAGIATDDNLSLLGAKGYDHEGVSRSKIKDCKPVAGSSSQGVETKNKPLLTLQSVRSDMVTGFYLKVKSPETTSDENRV